MWENTDFNKCLDDCPVNGPHNCQYPWPCMVTDGYAKAYGLTIVYDKDKFKPSSDWRSK